VEPAFQALSGVVERSANNEVAIEKDKTKLIAFYLPQYHRIPENSQWWGPGFTEWTNVAGAKPNFSGHYQPRIPRELGFYDLTHPDTMNEQVELAKLYGITGFCFYHYWFSGQRILEKPVKHFLESDLDIEFCLCWANENWTRAWDGDTKDVLLEQKYADGDAEEFIDSLIPNFRDERYIRIDGKPIVVVYRAKDIPKPKRWFKIWRDRVRKQGFQGLHIAVVDFYDIVTPGEVGADSIIEFPPHKFNDKPTRQEDIPKITNPEFSGGIVDYSLVIEKSAKRSVPPFKLFRGIMPSWDNTARRQNSPTIVINAQPDLFGAWLRYLRSYTRKQVQDTSCSLIFINAWNEWGEGCYLEPDCRFGLSYLEEVLKTSFFETELGKEPSLDEARVALFNEVSDIMAGRHKTQSIEEKHFFGLTTTASANTMRPIRFDSQFVRNISAALVKWPLIHKAAKFVYLKTRRRAVK